MTDETNTTARDVVSNPEVGRRSREEIEQIVILERLARYNRGLPCGAVALHRRLKEDLGLRPVPSVRVIGQILARHELTHARTGWYHGEEILASTENHQTAERKGGVPN